jgi:hypothetical protein
VDTGFTVSIIKILKIWTHLTSNLFSFDTYYTVNMHKVFFFFFVAKALVLLGSCVSVGQSNLNNELKARDDFFFFLQTDVTIERVDLCG